VPAGSSPSVVVGGLVVNLVSFLLGGGDLEEMLCESELAIHLHLCKTVVLHIELGRYEL
jgi:hypothetical protein